MLAGFFVDTDKLILTFLWKVKGSYILKTILKNNKVERLVQSEFF